MLSGFSGQVVFERWSIGLYNVVSYIYVYFTLIFIRMHCVKLLGIIVCAIETQLGIIDSVL